MSLITDNHSRKDTKVTNNNIKSKVNSNSNSPISINIVNKINNQKMILLHLQSNKIKNNRKRKMILKVTPIVPIKKSHHQQLIITKKINRQSQIINLINQSQDRGHNPKKLFINNNLIRNLRNLQSKEEKSQLTLPLHHPIFLKNKKSHLKM